MKSVEKRHLIRKRSKERSEIKTVEGSQLYQEAIKEVMNGRAEIVRCYKLIRELQSSISIYQATFTQRVLHDSQETPTDAIIVENRSEEPALTSGQE